MKFFAALVIAAIVCGCSTPRQLITEPRNPAKWTGKVEYAPEHEREGKGPCFVLYGRYPTPLIYKEYFPVDPQKTYVVKASFRTLDEKLPASAYMGLELYDAQKRKICFRNVAIFKDTYSEVVSARKGDRFMIVKNNDLYLRLKHCAAAFNVKKDLSDLPNFEVSPQFGKRTLQKDGTIRIELKGKLKKSYPAGTPTRLHSPWGTTLYFLASGWMPAGDGVDRSASLYGIMTTPGTSSKQFWMGTKYVRPFIWFGNWNRRPKEGAKLLVDGFSFEEIDGKL